jgi:peptide methionine sulfoxide reductase MsrA
VFWGLQRYFSLIHGVVETQAGYANGPTDSTSYEQVCADSGHAETVRVGYDAAAVTENLRLFLVDTRVF